MISSVYFNTYGLRKSKSIIKFRSNGSDPFMVILKVKRMNIIRDIYFHIWRLTITTLLVASTFTAAHALEVYQWVGITSNIYKPDIGLMKFSEICGSEFPGSRMCTSKELMETHSRPPIQEKSPYAWVQPIIASLGETDGTHPFIIVEQYTGVKTQESTLNCKTWRSTDWKIAGLAIELFENEERRFGPLGCNTTAHIACCAVADVQPTYQIGTPLTNGKP